MFKLNKIITFIKLLPLFVASAVLAVDVVSENDQREKERQQQFIDETIRSWQQRSQTAPGGENIPPEGSQTGEQQWFVKQIHVDQQGENCGPDLSDILPDYENRLLSRIAMLSLVRDITNRYVKKGFSTTLMALDFSQLSEGILRVQVLWGRVAGITLNGQTVNNWRDSLLINSTLPAVTGNILNLNAIDQAVDNLNNGIQTAKVKILAASQPGYSVIDISTSNQYLFASLTADNGGSGEDKSGRWKNTLTLAMNGVIGNGDKINLFFSQNYYQDSKNNYYRSAGTGWSVPWGSWMLSLSGNLSFYRQQIQGSLRNYRSDGDNADWTGTLSKVLSRSARQKTVALASVNYKNYRNYLEDQKIIVSSRDYSELRLGMNRVQGVGSGTLYGDISLNYGVPWFHARPGLTTRQGEQRSHRLTGNLSWTQVFPMKTKPVNWTTRMGWQYSPGELPSGAKISIGDEYTVKGFSSVASVAGDSGVWLSSAFSSTFQPFSTTDSLTFFTGLEYGLVKGSGNDNESRLASASAGLRINSKLFFSSLTMGYPLYASRMNRQSKPVFWFSAGIQY